MDSLENSYGYVIAVLATIVAAILVKYGYDDYQDKDTATKGMIMIAVAVAVAAGSWWLAYSYSA